MNLSAAANIEIPAYKLLIELGYEVTKLQLDGSKDVWTATQKQDRFTASGLVELLGVIKLAECNGENWQVSDEFIDNFLTEFE